MESGFGKGLFWGLVVGGVAGIVAGVLLAPKSGRSVRHDIASRLNEFIESDYPGEDHPEPSVYNEGKAKGEALIADAREKAEVLLADAERLLDAIKHNKPVEATA
ncbi:MAG: YtxH domain-containing protein [Bacteroidetes bacterium]|nr:YtxH domain-containing protein [Bacteroidota bacterium]